MENKPEYILLFFNAYSRVTAFLDATVTVTRAKLAGLTSPGVLEQKGSRKSGSCTNIYPPVSVVRYCTVWESIYF